MQISILGCGWLGLPLARTLVSSGFTVNGSTTSLEKVPLLDTAGISAFLISLNANAIDGDIVSFLKRSEVLIIDIPPKLRGENRESYIDKIRALIPYIETSGIKKVMFASSTAVYPDTNTVVTELSPAQPETESGKQIVEAENLLLTNDNFRTTILRFGGLTGEDRKPIKYLAGKENLENPDGPVNLIHQKDCIGIILKVIEKDIWGEIFNAVAPYHPTREEHYTRQAVELNLPLPKFRHDKPSIGKTVDSKKVIEILGYNFQEN